GSGPSPEGRSKPSPGSNDVFQTYPEDGAAATPPQTSQRYHQDDPYGRPWGRHWSGRRGDAGRPLGPNQPRLGVARGALRCAAAILLLCAPPTAAEPPPAYAEQFDNGTCRVRQIMSAHLAA